MAWPIVLVVISTVAPALGRLSVISAANYSVIKSKMANEKYILRMKCTVCAPVKKAMEALGWTVIEHQYDPFLDVEIDGSQIEQAFADAARSGAYLTIALDSRGNEIGNRNR